MELISTCCGADLWLDLDICSACKEHCGAVDENDNDYEFSVNKWKPKTREFSKEQLEIIEKLTEDVNED